MKKRIFISLVAIFILLFSINVYANEIDTTSNKLINKAKVTIEYKKDEQSILDGIPRIGCKAAYIAEPNTGKVIYEKNAHEKMYPASTTKILTALVVLENCKPTDTAIVSKKAIDLVPSGYSNAKLQAGEELEISSLLYALLIPSANEAANVLAEHVSGSIEDFAELCNKRAKELGCEKLHFVNANGIHDKDHYCSAYDLYLIAKECQKYEIFNEIVKTKSFTVPATNVYRKKDRTFTNTNSLLLPGSSNYYYPYCTGIKTGHTTPAGNCLVASSSYNNIDLISVVLGGGTNSKGLNERFYDTKQLFEFAYKNYSIKKIVDEKAVLATINVAKATKDTSSLDIIVDTNISSIVPNDLNKENIKKEITLDEEIIAPIKQNQVLGQITFKADGLNYTTNLIASHEVKKIPYWIYNSLFVGAVLIFLIIIIVVIKSKKKRESKN